jgi:hypothetical protein
MCTLFIYILTGLPEPRKNHAVVMATFAHHCLKRMNITTKQLETQLGPSTGELKARVGIHSGPVTAGKALAGGMCCSCGSAALSSFHCCTGVLRGQKARFQLFGTVSHSKVK